MDESEITDQKTMNELQSAKQTLSKVEYKLRSFRKERQETKPREIRAPMPDLSKYLSYFAEEEPPRSNWKHKQENRMNTANLTEGVFQQELNQHSSGYKEQSRHYKSYREDIQDRLLEEKNNSLQKLEDYYRERNGVLDAKIQHLKQSKIKIQRDKLLLIRDNAEIEREIMLKKELQHKSVIEDKDQLVRKIESGKVTLAKLISLNEAAKNRIQVLETNIQECLKINKQVVKSNMTKKNTSSRSMLSRCPYH